MSKVNGLWVEKAQTLTAADGSYSFAVGPFSPSTKYVFRVVVDKRPGYAAAISDAVRVRSGGSIQPAASATVSAYAPTTVGAASSATFFGAVGPTRGGVTVLRQRKIDGVWSTLASATSRPDGTYDFAVGPFAAGTTYTYRIVAVGDVRHVTAFSREFAVTAV